MTLYKREGSKYYWVRLERKGKVIQKSSGKTNKGEARRLKRKNC